MKKLILSLITLAIGHTAMASISPDSSWEEIIAAKGPYRIAAPTVYMGRSIDYMFVCRDGDNLRTMKPVDTVVTDSNRNGRTRFIVTGTDYLSTPIKYSLVQDFCDQTHHKTVCKPIKITGEYPMTVDVKIMKRKPKSSSSSEKLWFTKSYTIPECDTPQPH